MASILLVVIYIAFISLGLPDALLGSAWPSMYTEMGAQVSWAGILSMIIAGGTILSSLLSDRVIRRFGTGRVTAVSVGMTAVALLGFSCSGSFWLLCLWAIPYGLGAGSVDTALNNFVALHYKSRHMSWLHCFWGLGASLGPYIMGLCLTRGLRWNAGYRVIGILQTVLVAGLILSLPLWKKQAGSAGAQSAAGQVSIGLRQTLKLPGAKAVLLTFFCYCSAETTAGLWASSYLVLHRGISPQTAAQWASLFFVGITVGRFLSGFITDRMGDHAMVRLGIGILVAGAALVLFPAAFAAPVGLVCIGLGCAPIFPSLLHETPVNFGAQNSQSIMGMQMASAYVGSTLMPPVFGLIAQYVNIGLFPVYVLLFAGLMLIASEWLHRVCGQSAVKSNTPKAE